MFRTVQFWRLTQWDGRPLPRQFPGDTVVGHLQSAERAGLSRYRRSWDGYELLGQGLFLRPHPLIALYRTRRDNLPRLDDGGTISSLPLTGRQALAEPSYFLFLPRNIVALLFNNDGPRAPRLVDYLNAKLGCNVALQPIYREDIADVLEEMRVTAIEVTVSSAQVPLLGGGDDWVEVLSNASSLIEDGAISIRLSVGRTGDARDKLRKATRLRQLASLLRARGQDEIGRFDRLKVRGVQSGSGNPVTVDLLNEKFVARVDVDAESLTDVRRGASIALGVLADQWDRNQNFLEDNTPPVAGAPDPRFVGTFVETPRDERDG